MARYKTCNYAQMKMVAVSYEQQILPGTFEHTLVPMQPSVGARRWAWTLDLYTPQSRP